MKMEVIMISRRIENTVVFRFINDNSKKEKMGGGGGGNESVKVVQ